MPERCEFNHMAMEGMKFRSLCDGIATLEQCLNLKINGNSENSKKRGITPTSDKVLAEIRDVLVILNELKMIAKDYLGPTVIDAGGKAEVAYNTRNAISYAVTKLTPVLHPAHNSGPGGMLTLFIESNPNMSEYEARKLFCSIPERLNKILVDCDNSNKLKPVS